MPQNPILTQNSHEVQSDAEAKGVTMNNPYTLIKDNDKVTLFVNSDTSPYKEIPLDHYSYNYPIGKENVLGQEQFYRLYNVVYLQEQQIQHSVLIWYPIEIKTHCKLGMKQLIDMMKAAKEFVR